MEETAEIEKNKINKYLDVVLIAIIADVVFIIFVFYLFSGKVQQKYIISWFLFALGLNIYMYGIRLASYKGFSFSTIRKNIFTANLLHGISWGVISVVAYYSESSSILYLFLLFVILVMVAGSVVTMAELFSQFSLHTVTILTPVIVVHALNPTGIIELFTIVVTILLLFTVLICGKILSTKYDEIFILNHKLKKSNESKTRFIENMSHELRTPLQTIIASADELQCNSSIDTKEFNKLGIIKTSSLHIEDIINNLLESTKLRTGKALIHNSTFDLVTFVNELRSTISPILNYEHMQYNLLRMNLEVEGMITTDRTKLKQILINLITNANKHTTKGTITVSVQSKDESSIVFRIEDTGIGISQNKLDLIFEEFYQNEDSKQQLGLGLGLAIAKNACHALGGIIKVESIYGKGSIFSVELPRGKPIPAHDNIAKYTPNATNLKILLAEDVEINRIHFIDMLESNEHVISAVENGTQALLRLMKDTYDLAVLDYQMPGLNGFEVIKAYQASTTSNQRCPIIVLTANATDEVIDNTKRYNVHLLTKPILRQDLINMINFVIHNKPFVSPSYNLFTDTETVEKDIIENLIKKGRYEEFVRLFKEQGIKTLEAIRKTSDVDYFIENIHKLGGGSGPMGANELRSMCINYESQLRSDANVDLKDIATSLEFTFNKTLGTFDTIYSQQRKQN